MKKVLISTSFGSFHAQLLGTQGDWVICWPAQALDGESLMRFAQILAQTHRVVLVDPPAVGLNQHLPYTAQLDELVAYAHSLLMSLGIQRCHWVGHSSGGPLGAALHAAMPNCLQSLSLASSPMLKQSHVKQHKTILRALFAGFEQGRRFLAKRFAREVGASNGVERAQVAEHFLRSMNSIAPHNIRKLRPLDGHAVRQAFDEVRKKTVPILVLSGAHDGVVWPRDQRTVAEITQGTYVELNCGHLTLQMRAEECASAFLSFTQKLPSK